MKQNEILEKIPSLSPADFFNLSCDLYSTKDRLKSKHALKDTCKLLAEEPFAACSMAWNKEGILFEAKIDQPFENCFFPEYREGDSIELFIDTRDLKTAGFLTRFCHHFVFLPKPVEEIRAQEMTHFRTEDAHPLCNPEHLKVEAEFHPKKYVMLIFIPADCLCGYDPQSFDRLGFTYRINRVGNAPQHFSVSSYYYAIEKHPALWASFKLKH